MRSMLIAHAAVEESTMQALAAIASMHLRTVTLQRMHHQREKDGSPAEPRSLTPPYSSCSNSRKQMQHNVRALSQLSHLVLQQLVLAPSGALFCGGNDSCPHGQP